MREIPTLWGDYERSGLCSDAVRAWELEPAESRCQNSGTKVPEFFSCLVLEKMSFDKASGSCRRLFCARFGPVVRGRAGWGYQKSGGSNKKIDKF